VTAGSVSDRSWTDEPGTIDDLVADAQARDFPATKRLVYDWVGLGLLDHPQRRTRGGEGGSELALWPATQRNLFRALVDKRPGVKDIATLCNVPVFFWTWWGDDHAPTHQVQRALQTWAGKVGKVSWSVARQQARRVVDFLDDVEASRSAREQLITVLAETGFNRRLDRAKLTEAVRAVFDPGQTNRTYGTASIPLTTEDCVELIAVKLRGMQRAAEPAPIEELNRARLLIRTGLTRYQENRPTLIAGAIRQADAPMFDELTTEKLLNEACANLMVALGGIAGGPYSSAAQGQRPNRAARRKKTIT
jgi:hypothetical protein